MQSASVELLDGVVVATGTDVAWPGGTGVFAVECAGFNGATVALHVMLPRGTFVAAGTQTNITANGAGIFSWPPGRIKAVISGAVPSAGVAASAQRIPV